MTRIVFTSLLCLIVGVLAAQEDSIRFERQDQPGKMPIPIKFSYADIPTDFLYLMYDYTPTKPIVNLTESEYNQGYITNIWQMIQAKAPGLMVSKAGNDPNTLPDVRIRGLSTFSGRTEPLIVVNGVEGVPLSLIDPNDVVKIEVLRDAASLAQYGMRGAAGVVLITTKYVENDKWQVSYSGLVSSEQQVRRQPFLDATGYLTEGGNNRGTSTDWVDKITQNAVSQVHHLDFSGGHSKAGKLTVSMNFRDAEGVLRHSGNTQYGGRMLYQSQFFKNRVLFSFGGSANKIQREYGFVEAFKYANTFNPTAPVFDANNSINGGYYQTNDFDVLNPVAIIDQNTNTADELFWQAQARLHVRLFRSWMLDMGYSRIGHQGDYEQKYADTSPFRGLFNNRSNTSEAKFNSDHVNVGLRKSIHWKQTLSVETYFGFEFLMAQDTASTNYTTGIQQYIRNYDLPLGNNNSIGMYSGMSNIHVEWKNMYSLRLTSRNDHSARLGKNDRNQKYYGISMGADLGKRLKLRNTLKLNAGYGITGMQPARTGMTEEVLYDMGGGVFGVFQKANPDLKPERTTGIDLGINAGLFNNKVMVSINAYKNKTDRIIIASKTFSFIQQQSYQFQNLGELQNQGIEATLRYQTAAQKPMQWQTGLMFAASTTSFGAGIDSFRIGNLGGPGMASLNSHLVGPNLPLGQFETAVTTGKVINGLWEVKDLNGDGFGNNFDDQTAVGNALPNFYFGWYNTLNYKQFDVNMTIRGAVGHDILNANRAFYESNIPPFGGNRIRTEYYNPLVSTSIINDIHIENGNYVRLDNLAVGYSFNIKKMQKLRVYVAANNLLTLTNYTGADPEIRLSNYSESENGAFISNEGIFTPGVDRRVSYAATRVLAVGIQAGF